MTKALYRKWRPQGWEEVIAQEHVVQTLKNAVANERVAHAYLFAGPRGTGKTTTARLLAKAVNCLDPDLAQRPCNTCDHCLALNAGRFLDLIEIDAASNTSVDDVRDLREKINFSPSLGRYKVYIIDEVHMLSNAAFNALLKTLEEPPPHAIFVLATTEIHKIPATVLSRCQRHEFRRIPIASMVIYLKEKSQAENIAVDDPVFTEIARQATGSLRDAVSMLDQLTASNEHITLEMTQSVLGTATSLRVIEVISAMADRDTASGLALINSALDSGTDARQFSRQIVTYLRNILLFKLGNNAQIEVSESVREMLNKHAQLFSMPELLQAIEAFNRATTQEQANWHPGLGLELAFTAYLVETDPQAEPSQNALETLQRETSKPDTAKTRGKAASRKQVDEPLQEQKAALPEAQNKAQEQDLVVIHEEAQESASIQAKPELVQVNAADDPVLSQPGGEISVAVVQKSWSTIKALLKKHNPRTEGLLNTSKIIGIKQNTLMLGFSSAILKEMMEKEGNLTLTMDILEEVLGQPMLIECIVTAQEGSLVPEDLKIEQDGIVSTATRDLGGRISRAQEDQ